MSRHPALPRPVLRAPFTLAAALGAKALGRLGVLPTRLSGVDEAATLDVLCSNETRTLTLNDLSAAALHPEAGFDGAHLPARADRASADAGQDPVDAAIGAVSAKQTISDPAKLTKLAPSIRRPR